MHIFKEPKVDVEEILSTKFGWVDGQAQAICELVGSNGIFVVQLGMLCSLVVELRSMLRRVSAV